MLQIGSDTVLIQLLESKAVIRHTMHSELAVGDLKYDVPKTHTRSEVMIAKSEDVADKTYEDDQDVNASHAVSTIHFEVGELEDNMIQIGNDVSESSNIPNVEHLVNIAMANKDEIGATGNVEQQDVIEVAHDQYVIDVSDSIDTIDNSSETYANKIFHKDETESELQTHTSTAPQDAEIVHPNETVAFQEQDVDQMENFWSAVALAGVTSPLSKVIVDIAAQKEEEENNNTVTESAPDTLDVVEPKKSTRSRRSASTRGSNRKKQAKRE